MVGSRPWERIRKCWELMANGNLTSPTLTARELSSWNLRPLSPHAARLTRAGSRLARMHGKQLRQRRPKRSVLRLLPSVGCCLNSTCTDHPEYSRKRGSIEQPERLSELKIRLQTLSRVSLRAWRGTSSGAASAPPVHRCSRALSSASTGGCGKSASGLTGSGTSFYTKKICPLEKGVERGPRTFVYGTPGEFGRRVANRVRAARRTPTASPLSPYPALSQSDS